MGKPRTLKGLPKWRSVYSYTREFTDKGRQAKNVLRRHTIKFKTEFDKVIKAVLILVRNKDYEKAYKLLEKDGLM